MSDENVQLIAAAILALCELYMIRGHDFPLFAWVWDFIARVTGKIANVLGRISMQARINYFEVVQA